MADKGLHRSIWAATSRSDAIQVRKCKSCGISNFSQTADYCFRCAHDPNTSRKSQNVKENILCRAVSTGGLQTITPSQSPRDENPAPPDPNQNGLAKSRWAPRQSLGNGKADQSEVWTRTTIHTAVDKYHTSVASTPSEPDLPYQVQHFILSTMQRILEEACFDLAKRWVPEALYSNNWDCPEAVELAKWRDFLPGALPPNAVKPLPHYTLDAALGHAVQVRNKAVHRHLCSNDELRRMALKSRDTMIIFSDHTRISKFQQLWVELNEWDRNGNDAQLARQKMESALREIGERPIDDMDWTPNAVSLFQIPDVDEDVMDLDF